jgi:mono/diheme cytochrome c family protein
MKRISSYISRLAVVAFCLMMLTGCTNIFAFRQWMYDQPRARAYDASTFFDDGRSARPEVPGTVAVDDVPRDGLLLTGQIDGQDATVMPFPVTEQVLNRGQQQYNIYCAPCHGLVGYGDGMVSRRGGTPPTNYHSDYLRNQPIGYFYNVMTNGFRNMRPYDQKLTPEDRWAVAAYIRALQLSQNVSSDMMENLPAEAQTEIQGLGQ